MLEPRSVVEWAAVVALSSVAAVSDVRTGRVPNVLTVGATLAALAFSLLVGGVPGFVTSLSGALIGLMLFLPFFALGGMGGGDVKLLAAAGSWLGPWGAVCAALGASLAGGIVAIAIGLSKGYLRQAMRNLLATLAVWQTVGPSPVPELTLAESAGPRLPYAVPIGIGAIVALWLGR